jgi:outer membrane protein OmpA-like peptidoglycan-associated protein/tetratricopeptide (TPR) repeat protein
MHKALITVFFLIIINSLKAQYSKGNQLFEKGFYDKSIPYFQKALSGKEADKALEKIAQAYLKLRKFDEAEKYYAQLIQKTNAKPIHYFEYGEALMGNSKYEEAKKQFKTYSKLNPSDKRGELMAKACQDIQQLINQQPNFSVYAIPSINSNEDDFCPQITSKGLVFISDRPVNFDYVNSTSYKAEQKLNILLAEKHQNTHDSLLYNLPKIYDFNLNKGYYNGPVSFNDQFTYMAFTRVELLRSDKNKVNRPQIYFAENKGGNQWVNITPFPYNSPNYSCMHPALSPDGKTLVFASDMEDSEGGMDLYICEKQGDTWTKPRNLGKIINTPQNEVFPYFSPSGTLYFSSNGHGGFGGLDIFATSLENGSWTTPVNLLSPLNSSYDDFGIVFDKEERRGFFSSNRPGGLGKDDIYGFYYSNKKITITGKILLSENLNDGAANIKLLLVTEDGTVVQTTSTDKSGYFKFVNLPEDKKYLLKIDENDTSLESFKKIYLADQNNKIRKKTTTDDKGVFTFYNLPLNPDLMKSEIEDDTRITITGSLLFGENPAKPLINQDIVLLNDKGEVIAKGKTDAYGSFKFVHLPPEQNYYVALEASDTKLAPNTRIIVTDNKGKTVRTFFTDVKGGFKFEVLASESNTLRVLEEEDTSLRIEYKGKLFSNNNKEPLANTKVQLIDSKGKVIQSTITDAYGNFKFINLPFDKNYFISVEEKDVAANIRQVYIADEKGNIIRKLIFEKGKFNFEILPEDKQKLATIYVEDPWLKMKEIKENKKDSIIVIENIYYEYGKWNITSEGAKILDKVVNIMKENPDIFIELSSHTDSRSSAEFNLELSRKRAKAAVDYILSKGIEKHRITGVGMGETKLVNYCADGVECTEEQHAQNRRTEFKVVKQKIN